MSILKTGFVLDHAGSAGPKCIIFCERFRVFRVIQNNGKNIIIMVNIVVRMVIILIVMVIMCIYM